MRRTILAMMTAAVATALQIQSDARQKSPDNIDYGQPVDPMAGASQQ